MTHPIQGSLRAQRGFTLVEVTIALMILGIIGVAATKLLMVQSRFYDKQTNMSIARSVARSSMNVVMSDLRMVQDVGGVTAASSDGRSLTVVVPYRFGLVCKASLLTVTVSMLPSDSATVAQSVYGGFAWRDSTTGTYTSVTTTGGPSASSNPANCTGNSGGQAQIRTVSMNGRSGSIYDLMTTGIVTAPQVGSAVFFWSKITYAFKLSSVPEYAAQGYFGLYRTVGSTNEELLAPFDSSTSRFRYYTPGLDTSTSVLPALNQIRGVDLVLNSVSPKASVDKTIAHSPSYMQTSVFFKNISSF
jgi:prepilin-type N-terminal cleavage/methylation domain-containing protein